MEMRRGNKGVHENRFLLAKKLIKYLTLTNSHFYYFCCLIADFSLFIIIKKQISPIDYGKNEAIDSN